ncbi:MAG: hypothetical protein M1822_008012 [Bathelium mastoideum]|nr:MAG: hypothetical protein M1822_008012 [Bathelium mastoideum]
MERPNGVQQSCPSRRVRACKQCRASKVRCSGNRPCERCTRRRDACTFAADDVFVSVPEPYLRFLQRQVSQSSAATTTVASTTNPSAAAADADINPLGTMPTALDPAPIWLGSPRSTDVGFRHDGHSSHESAAAIDSVSVQTRLEHGTQERSASSSSRAVRAAAETDLRASAYLPRPHNPLVARDVAYVRGSDARRLLFLGHTSTWSFCRRAFTLLEDAAGSPDNLRAPLNLDGAAFYLKWQPKASVDASDLLKLPPVDHALLLYNTVKFRLGELFSIVHEADFLRLFHDFHRQPLETAQAHVLWFVEYLMLLAFGKAFTCAPGPAATAPAGCELAARALSLLPDVAFLQDERPAVLAIEVLWLIALYFQSIDMRSAAYQYVGQALRLAFHDGLHRAVSDDVLDPVLASRCSDTWWTSYVLDQEITAGLGCPPAVPQNSVTTALPTARSASPPAQALTLRIRLSRIVSSICSTAYESDEGLGPDFVRCTTAVLQRLAEVSREIDEIMSASKTCRRELPHMFYNTTLYYHYVSLSSAVQNCIILATRPLVIWLLVRSVPPNAIDACVIAGPIASLLEKSAQSAATTLLMLIDLVERDMLETFLPFQLEYAFSSAVLLAILSAILPTYVPDTGWRRAVSSTFEEMAKKRNVVVPLRKAELEHLEALLGVRQRRISPLPTPPVSASRTVGESGGVQPGSRGLGASFYSSDENQEDAVETAWNSSCGAFDFFVTNTDDVFALAEQFEHGDLSTTFTFD